MKHVIGEYSLEELILRLKHSLFCIMVDESTDCSSTKSLAIVARTVTNLQVKDEFLGLMPIANATAIGMYNTNVQFFKDHNICS